MRLRTRKRDVVSGPDRTGASPTVLIIVQNLSVPLDRRVWLECRALRAAGYGVAVICPQHPGEAVHEVLEGVDIYRYPPRSASSGVLSYAVEFGYSWMATARLSLRVWRRHGFGAIQTCNPPDTYWALAWPYKKLAGCAFVYDQHDLCPEVFASRFGDGSPLLLRGLHLLERLNYRVADRVVVPNTSYRDVAVVRGGRPAHHVTVVRSGPATEVMTPGPPSPELAPPGRTLCCYLGVMGPQDGVHLLLESWATLVHEFGRRDAHLALLGFGDCLEELRDLAHELRLDEHVTFTGRVGPPEIERYLRTAEIGLQPDPLSPLNDVSTMNKTMEYMAYGLPVVAYDLKETRVTAGDCAVYVAPNDTRRYAIAIAELLDNPARRRSLGRSARARCVEQLDWSHQARRYVAVYDLLLRGQITLPAAEQVAVRPELPAEPPDLAVVGALALDAGAPR